MCGRHAAVQFGAARGGSAAEPRLGGFCQLVRIVRRHPRAVSAQESKANIGYANRMRKFVEPEKE